MSAPGKVEPRAAELDEILETELGQAGPYQLRALLLAAVTVVFVAFTTNEYVFTAARIRTRCLIPECDADPPEFSPPWLPHAVPPSGPSFDSCARFPNASSSRAGCPPALFDTSRTEPCAAFVYETTDTAVYDFGLACEEWKRTFIGMARTIGILIGMPISGYASDRWGRRAVLAVVSFNAAWLGLLRYWAGSYAGLLASVFVEAVLSTGGFACVYILLMEILGPKYRVAGGAVINTSFSVGQILLALLAWAVPNWRKLTLTLYAPQLVTISYFWIMAESVRWLMSKGRFDEAEKVLKEMARVNGTVLSDNSLQGLRVSAEENNRKRELEIGLKSNEPMLIVKVFQYKAVLLRCMVVPVWWITMTFVFYGLTINSVDMTGNRYVNYMAVCAAEIPGYWAAVFLLTRVGRKVVLVVAYWICAACQFGYIFMPNDQHALSLALYLVGKWCIAIVVTSLYVYTIELFPTRHRHTLLAFCSMLGRVGSIVAPLTPAFGAVVWTELPFVLFGGFAFLSGALVFLTPETLGADLPDTLAQANRLGTRGGHLRTRGPVAYRHDSSHGPLNSDAAFS